MIVPETVAPLAGEVSTMVGATAAGFVYSTSFEKLLANPEMSAWGMGGG